MDGVASACLMSEVLEAAGHEVHPVPIGYAARNAWLKDPGDGSFAVCDFLYHPRAVAWADHHPTAFERPADEAHWRGRVDTGWFWYDPSARSCAALLQRVAAERGVDVSHLEDLAALATKTDSADYSSPEEAVYGQSPGLRLARALVHEPTDSWLEELVRVLRSADISSVAKRPEVVRRVHAADERMGIALKRLGSRLLVESGVARFTWDLSWGPLNRYAPYLLAPNARYSIGVLLDERADTSKVTAMRNPWLSFQSIPLGQLMGEYGGGGHERVGSVVLTGDARARVSDVTARVMESVTAS